jgi:hypothetical protein
MSEQQPGGTPGGFFGQVGYAGKIIGGSGRPEGVLSGGR